MKSSLIAVADGFWNLRGSFRTAGIVDIGTQASLVRRKSGRYVMLDCCGMSDAVAGEVRRITNGGDDLEAIVNLHPFHTLHVRATHAQYPRAKLHGTARHKRRFPDLPWEEISTEDAAMARELAGDLELSIPRGVDFISEDARVHFSSVLALHRASGTIHVDDTLMYVHFPAVLRLFGLKDTTRLHPTLGKALERRAGAARDFREWFEELVTAWGDATNLCAAHTAPLIGRDHGDLPLRNRLHGALARGEQTLRAHERKYG